MGRRDAASPSLPAMSFAPSSAVAFEPEEADNIDWSALLHKWLDVFTTGAAEFGLVDDWRADGSSYKRFGVIVELCADVTKLGTRVHAWQRLREAIDLAQLLLAIRPSAIKRVLLRRTDPTEPFESHKFAEELSSMARGVPGQFLTLFMEMGDKSLSNEALFQARRQEMLDKLFHRPATLKRFAHLAAQSAMRTQLVVDTLQTTGVDALGSEQVMGDLHEFLLDLDHYQSRRSTDKPSIVSRHQPFRVQKVELLLRRLHITPHVVESAKKLMAVGIPVDLSRLNLDFRLISCNDEDLHAFVRTITAGASKLIVDAGTMFNHTHEVAAHVQGRDQRQRIRRVVKAIASIPNLHGVNLAEMLKLCTTPLNREAVWRGLFEHVLSRDEPLRLLTFCDDVCFADEDAGSITECAQRWKQANPGKILRVGQLEFDLKNSFVDAVRSLLLAFDDMEKFSLDIHFDNGTPDEFVPIDIVRILGFPSLSALSFSGIDIPTMDLFDPSIPHPSLPTKPTLREIDFRDVEIDDPVSLPRFLGKLHHTEGSPKGLARTLRVLRVVQHGYSRPPLFHCDTLTVMDEMLSTNNMLADVALTVNCGDKEAHNLAKALLQKHHRRAVVTETQSEIAKARNLALLSVIGSRAVGPRAQLDATLVRQIFAFSAPHKERRMSVDPW